MRWRWPPWRREEPEDGHDAAQARKDAARKLREAEKRWPEVHRARNQFAAEVEAAMARRRHQ